MQTARLSDTQWYLNRSHNIVYMAFVLPEKLTPAGALDLISNLIETFPGLGCHADLSSSEHFQAPRSTPTDRLDVRAPQDHNEAISHLLTDLVAPFTPGLKPTFRCSMVPSVEGDSTLMFFSAPHAVIEGIDTLRLDAKHKAEVPTSPGTGLRRALISAIALPVTVLQIGLAPLVATPRHLYARRIVSVDRHAFRAVAREKGISWQGLLLASLVLCDGRSLGARLRLPRLISIAEVPKARSGLDDNSIRFRPRLCLLRPTSDLFRLAAICDRKLHPSKRRSAAPYRIITAGLPFHRRLASWLPFLYPSRSFQYFPADLSFSVMPPFRAHRFGKLGAASFVVCGSNTPGLTSCIVTNSKGRQYLGLNLRGTGEKEVSALSDLMATLGLEVDVLV